MSRGPEKQFDPEVVLAKAMEVFWARGYEAASLSELLAQMGIGRKSLYDTFGNKRALFLRTLEQYAQTTIKAIRDQLSAPGSPLANIKRVLLDFQRTHAIPGSKGCMLGTNIADFDTNDQEMAFVLRSYLREVEDAFCRAILRAQQSGELKRTLNPREVAQMLLCTTQGMALIGRVLDDETVLRGTVEATLSLFERA